MSEQQPRDGDPGTTGKPDDLRSGEVTEGMKASLVSREVIADSVELVSFGERMDALVTVAEIGRAHV